MDVGVDRLFVGKRRGGKGREARGSIRKIFSPLVFSPSPFICERLANWGVSF